jgi:gliding motility-associated-like protein
MNPFWQNILKPFRNISLLPLCTMLVLYILSAICAFGQIDTRNKRPKIQDQKDLQINEGESITIQLTDLIVEDRDDWFYPFGFSLAIHDGSDYTFSDHTVTPAPNFYGTLTVIVTVNDGKDDSEPYNLRITINGINDAPVITQQQVITADEDNSVTISTSDLIISDPDNSEFTLTIRAGEHYTFSNSTITPEPDYSGALSVPVSVDDGLLFSNEFNVIVTVNPINDPPKITGQKDLHTQEDVPLILTAADLMIEDPDSNEFTIVPGSGEHYSISNSTIVPEQDYSGTLTIPVTVQDQGSQTAEFPLTITVNAINDVPKITGQQVLSTQYPSPIQLEVSHLIIDDPDNIYPDDFSLLILGGDQYTVSGNTITPISDNGEKLTVTVRVNDGTSESEDFPVDIELKKGNVKPVILNQKPVIINEDQTFTIEFSHLMVVDLDNEYPKDFSLKVSPGENYTLENTTVKPTANFSGNLFVKVSVNDGDKNSDPFNFQITVSPVNDAPILISTDADSTNVEKELSSIPILNDLSISDVDNEFLALAEVAIDPETYNPSTDVLQFTNTDEIKGVFDSPNGILALIGKASVEQYANALKSVQLAVAPKGSLTKKISIIVNDGQSNSKPVTKSLYRSEESVVSLEIPTGFTPNGDLVNDTWSISPTGAEQLEEATVRIYTRTGLLVFEADDLTQPWDGLYNGKVLPADVYYYTVDFKNDQIQSSSTPLKGIITILR